MGRLSSDARKTKREEHDNPIAEPYQRGTAFCSSAEEVIHAENGRGEVGDGRKQGKYTNEISHGTLAHFKGR